MRLNSLGYFGVELRPGTGMDPNEEAESTGLRRLILAVAVDDRQRRILASDPGLGCRVGAVGGGTSGSTATFPG